MPYGDRRLYGVCCAEKGTFRFNVRTSRHRRRTPPCPAIGRQRAAQARAGDHSASASASRRYDVTDVPRALLRALGEDPDDPAAAVAARARRSSRGWRALVEPRCASRSRRRSSPRGEKINVIPARAELRVDCRVPPGMGDEATMARVREVLGDAADGLDVDFTEAVVGNRSPVESPLMDAIRGWLGEHDPGAEAVPVVLPAFTDSRWLRAAFPDCVAYGFFPQRHQTLYETWPLIHADDERIDVRDLGFAAAFFHDLPRRLLA